MSKDIWEKCTFCEQQKGKRHMQRENNTTCTQQKNKNRGKTAKHGELNTESAHANEAAHT